MTAEATSPELAEMSNASASVVGGSPEAVLAAQAILSGTGMFESLENARVSSVGGDNPKAVEAAMALLSYIGQGQQSAMDRALAQFNAGQGPSASGSSIPSLPNAAGKPTVGRA